MSFKLLVALLQIQLKECEAVSTNIHIVHLHYRVTTSGLCLNADTHGNPEILFIKMLICALLLARTITPVVYKKKLNKIVCVNNIK